jgi:transposase-like protein
MTARKNFTAQFKAKVALQALKESNTLSEISSANGVHSQQISTWKKQLIDGSESIFTSKKKSNDNFDMIELQRIVGEQAIQLSWYKKKLGAFS